MPTHLPRTAAVVGAILLLLALAVAVPALAQSAEQPDPTGEPVTPDEGVPTGRVAGPDRIGTAIAIAQRAFPEGAPVAYLANAETTVDAVAGGTLVDGPILLVPTCALPDAVAAELARLAPQEVLALGGAAAVCDDVLAAAGVAAAGDTGGEQPGDLPDHVVTATAELVDPSGDVPFTVEASDPGPVFEGGTSDHGVRFTGTDGSVVLDDPRLTGVLTAEDGTGQLVVAGRGCGPSVVEGEVLIGCTEDFVLVPVQEGEVTATTVALHTDDAAVGEAPLEPGTYVLDQLVRWDADGDSTDPTFDDGRVTVRVTYEVAQPSGGDTPEEPGTEVVTWATPEGSFRTTGHSDVDLARIAEGVDRGEHIGIPNGVIHPGDGGVNIGRSWHLTDVEIVDATIEVCDGTADYVEAHLEDYLEIGRYCPWGAVPTAIEG